MVEINGTTARRRVPSSSLGASIAASWSHQCWLLPALPSPSTSCGQDGTWFGTNGDTRIDRAGLYQWDPDASPARYTEGLFGPFQAVALELQVYAGLLYRVGHRLFAPRTDFVIDAARLPPDGADVDANWIEATDVTATPGGSTIVTPGEVELPADWALNENGPAIKLSRKAGFG